MNGYTNRMRVVMDGAVWIKALLKESFYCQKLDFEPSLTAGFAFKEKNYR